MFYNQLNKYSLHFRYFICLFHRIQSAIFFLFPKSWQHKTLHWQSFCNRADRSLDVDWKQRYTTIQSCRSSCISASHRQRTEEDPGVSESPESDLRLRICGEHGGCSSSQGGESETLYIHYVCKYYLAPLMLENLFNK